MTSTEIREKIAALEVEQEKAAKSLGEAIRRRPTYEVEMRHMIEVSASLGFWDERLEALVGPIQLGDTETPEDAEVWDEAARKNTIL